MVSELWHIPAAALASHVELVALVDTRIERAAALGTAYQVPYVTANYRDLFGRVDAVVVALPNFLHAPVSIDFLTQGIHVLCEKPMATSVAEGRQMIDAAGQGGAKLAIGLMRRFFENACYAKQLIDSQRYGLVHRFEAEESSRFDLKTVSPFYIQKGALGAGVLFDLGVHTFDLLSWWFGEVRVVAYRDDSRGGIEANCHVVLETDSVQGTVDLSRYRRLDNALRLYTPDVVINVSMNDPRALVLQDGETRLAVAVQPAWSKPDQEAWLACYTAQLEAFAQCILQDRPPRVPGEEGLRSVALIERCLDVRQPLPVAEWERFTEPGCP
jgi:predicted dehydrogenase